MGSDVSERIEVALKVERNFLAWANVITLFGVLGIKLLTDPLAGGYGLGVTFMIVAILCLVYMGVRYVARIRGLQSNNPLVLIDKFGPPALVLLFCGLIAAVAIHYAVQSAQLVANGTV